MFHSFLCLSNIPQFVKYRIFFICSSVDGHLGCYHVLDVVNSDAMNIGVHVSFPTSVSSVYKSAFILDMLSFAFSSALSDGHPPILSVANGNPSSASVKKKKKKD